MLALEIHQVKKSYANGVEALKGVSIAVEEGDFLALLGPNGAGKSTLINILTSLVKKDSGKVKIAGNDIDHDLLTAKSYLGVVPQEFNFNIFETVQNILLEQAGYYGLSRKAIMPRCEYYLHKLGLEGKRNASAFSLSGGMKRRLMIARALVHQPRILILDEPTVGVDIEIRHMIWEFLTELNQQGTTIILTTHYLEEAENLCQKIAIINHGHIIANATMATMLSQIDKERFILYLQEPYRELPVIEGYLVSALNETTLEVEVSRKLGMNALFLALDKQKMVVISLRNKSNRLEELFLHLITKCESRRHEEISE